MNDSVTLPRYMTRFRCIAERCEDTCCSGLKVPVSPAQERRMRTTLGDTPHLADGFLQMRPDGGCPFLDPERMCSLQRRHGEALLPDICATFPRVVTRWEHDWEVAGTLACPEVARLCLLEEDSTLPEPGGDLAHHVSRPDAVRSFAPEPGDAYAHHARTVRAALLGWLGRREHPLGSRLALLARFALALEDVYFQGTPAFTDDGRAQALLDEALQHFDAPDTHAAVHEDFAALALPGGPCVGLFTSVVKARREARGARFQTLATGVLASLGLEQDSPEHLDAAWRTYAERWQRVHATHGARLDRAFHNYALHAVGRTPFTELPTLLGFVFRLTLRLGLLRLMLMGHPRVAALARDPSASDGPAALDAAVVETFQLVARHLEPSPELRALTEGLVETGRGARLLGKTLVFAAF